MPFDLAEGKMSRAPSYLLQYRGDLAQSITGLAFGPDGLYFAPVLPDASGSSQIFRISYDPTDPHLYTLQNDLAVSEFMYQQGCFGCHVLKASAGAQGPQIDSAVLVPRVQARLGSAAYRQSVAALDLLDEEPFRSYRAARQEVLAAGGTLQARPWIQYFLQEPRLDNPNAQMPNLGLSSAQAEKVASYILDDYQENPIAALWSTLVPVILKHLLISFSGIFLAGGISFLFIQRLVKRNGQRR